MHSVNSLLPDDFLSQRWLQRLWVYREKYTPVPIPATKAPYFDENMLVDGSKKKYFTLKPTI